MAITLRLDDRQMAELRESNRKVVEGLAALSDNLAKWQAQQVVAIEQGFAALVTILSGDEDPEEVQRKIEQNAELIRGLRQRLQVSVDNQTKGE